MGVANYVKVIQRVTLVHGSEKAQLGAIASRGFQNGNGRGLRVAAGRAGDGNIVAVHLVVGDRRQRIQLAVCPIPGMGKLVFGDSPVRYQDFGSVLADRNRVGEVADRYVLNHPSNGCVDDGNAIIAIAWAMLRDGLANTSAQSALTATLADT